jgi:hypothetical protein
MASSHQIKRVFMKFSILPSWLYDKVLHELFMWRLKIESPKIIILGIDTMVLDNDSSKKKEGCEVTYKKKKRFSATTYYLGAIFKTCFSEMGRLIQTTEQTIPIELQQ